MRFSNNHGYCELNPFPGCSQLVVSNHGVIFKEHRGEGHGNENHRMRVNRSIDLGYDAMICTVRSDNLAERHILSKNGWEAIFDFYSTESNHQIMMYARQINRKEKL